MVAKKPSKKKAKKILQHGKVYGKKLTKKQKRFFNTIAKGLKLKK